jgi:hypothetical protein
MASETRPAKLPGTGDEAPCAGYWQPQCKQQAARFLRKSERFPRCRVGHPEEVWSLRGDGPVRGAYGPSR